MFLLDRGLIVASPHLFYFFLIRVGFAFLLTLFDWFIFLKIPELITFHFLYPGPSHKSDIFSEGSLIISFQKKSN